MRIGSIGLAANLSRLLLRPVNTSLQPGEVEEGSTDLQTEATSQQGLLLRLQRSAGINTLTHGERQKAYQAMEDLSRQLLDETTSSSIDLSV